VRSLPLASANNSNTSVVASPASRPELLMTFPETRIRLSLFLVFLKAELRMFFPAEITEVLPPPHKLGWWLAVLFKVLHKPPFQSGLGPIDPWLAYDPIVCNRATETEKYSPSNPSKIALIPFSPFSVLPMFGYFF